jgi:hypothetical protein
MAIKIPILTSFDPKGMKQANAAFANLQGSVRSLGSNFAALGVALAGAGALIAKNVQSLARIETINAQTAQTISTMGNAANISASEVEALAGRLEALTATEAETIQQGANLLLTFRNISDQAGAGNDIFSRTTAIMVDMGRALGEDASASAIRLGKALNDPIRGLTALRKVGVGFTTEQEEQIKVLQDSGDIMGAQKIILAELQAQFGGSGAAFAKTFSGQLELMGHELGTIGEEATLAVLPALQGMVAQLRELIPIIGPQLKAAIESVDFVALTNSLVGMVSFFIQNGEAILKTVAALYALNTIFKLVTVATGIATVSAQVYTYVVAQMTAGVGIGTLALKAFRTALITTGVGAVLVGLGFLADFMINASTSTDRATNSLRNFAKTKAQIEMEERAAGRARATNPSLAPTFPVLPTLPSFGGGGMSSRAAAAKAAAEAAAAAEQAILDKRKSAFESFNESVKNLFSQIKDSIMNSFSLPNLGNSVNAITRNMAKLLEKTKSFASNIAKLSGLGLNSTLLQQVIQAGPMAGSQLASAIVGGGSGFINQLNEAFNEFGNLAGGIAGIGTERAFATQQTVNNYSISVTGGVATSSDVGRAVVNAIKDFERQSGTAWRG